MSGAGVTSAATAFDDALARRNAVVMALVQASAGSAATIVIGSSGIAALTMLGEDKSLATVPITTFVLGNMLSSVPASFFMARVGRRLGFVVGCLFGVLAGLLAAVATLRGSLPLLALATGLAGTQQAFVGFLRFAAADTASPAVRPKVISWVLAGGVAAAFVGPLATTQLYRLFDPILFAGSFLGLAGLSALGMAVAAFIRSPRTPPPPIMGGRPLAEIMLSTPMLVAVAVGAITYALMNFVMTAAPLAMIGCGLSVADAQSGIQWHVVAMFAPSFVTGSLISRFGAERVALAGFALLVGSAAVALAGLTVWNFVVALVLLGLGWNFGYIAATTLVAGLHAPAERAKVQAANDFVVFSLTTLGSLSSGATLAGLGWLGLNVLVFPVVAAAALLLVAAKRLRTTA